MKDPTVIYHLTVFVEERASIRERKYKMRRSANNWLPVDMTEEDWQADFANPSGRISPDSLGKVLMTAVTDGPGRVWREAYFTDEAQRKPLLTALLTEVRRLLDQQADHVEKARAAARAGCLSKQWRRRRESF